MKKGFFASTLICLCISFLFGQDSPPPELPPGWWMIPKTSTKFKLGGYVKLDMIHDFDPIGSPDFFDVSKIPVDGSEGTSTHFHVKETRLYLDVKTPFKGNEIRTYIEGDFYGTNGAFRVRHAFVDIGDKLLVGQFWSNFMDEAIIPPTLDYEKPSAYAFARHAMIRWKHKFSDKTYLGIALEEPSNNAIAPSEPGKYENPLPDLTARFRVTDTWGHVQLSGFGGQIRYRYNTGEKDDISLYGGNLSGQFNLLKKDKLIYQVVFGNGVGRYRGGPSAVPDENGDLEAITGLGYTAGYQHYWSDKWSSYVMYNFGSNNSPDSEPNTTIKEVSYIAANLIWYFAPNAFAGIEYLYGTREDVDGADGDASRLQMSVSYTFN
jgi:hypothetical protein